MRLSSMIRSAMVVAGLTSVAFAQNSIVWVSSSDGTPTADGGNGFTAVGTINNDGLQFVAPVPGSPYTAGPFLPASLAYVWYGDADNNGDFVKSSSTGPWGIIDAAFVKRFNGPANVGPREIYHSFAAPSYTVTSGTVYDGDVLRYDSNYFVEVFLHEAQVDTACGTSDTDLNAICQDASGNLFISFADTETVNGLSQGNGALFYIAATDITYDGSGNVLSINPGAAQLVADEAQMDAFVANSGARNAAGAAITLISELSALELDPNGGTFVAPANANLVLPNLIFGSGNGVNDYVIFSTANGGSIAVINGVQMGSTVASTGAHMGILPDSTGGDAMDGLALLPFQAQPFVMKHTKNELSSTGALWFRSEVAGATANAPLVWFVAFPDLVDRFSIVTLPGLSGEIYGAGGPLLNMGVVFADAKGYAGYPFTIPPALAGGGATVWQVIDIVAGKFATPSIFEF